VIRTRLTPVLEKYGFDAQRVETEGSASERIFSTEPPPEVAQAQETRNLYQDRVCGYGGPPRAADVTFAASPAAQPYCEAVAAQRNGQQAAGLDPAAVQSYVTSDTRSENLDTQDATAPAEIVADVSGYFMTGTPIVGGFSPVNPARVLDTRLNQGASTAFAGGCVPRPFPRFGSAVIHSPDRSGLPFAMRGAGAAMSTLPSAFRGTPAVGAFSH